VGRFILRFRGKGDPPARHAARLRALPSVDVIDDSGRMLLVEGDEATLRAALPGDDWLIAPERHYSLAGARPRARRAGR
jgi:hypothetical protein